MFSTCDLVSTKTRLYGGWVQGLCGTASKGQSEREHERRLVVVRVEHIGRDVHVLVAKADEHPALDVAIGLVGPCPLRDEAEPEPFRWRVGQLGPVVEKV